MTKGKEEGKPQLVTMSLIFNILCWREKQNLQKVLDVSGDLYFYLYLDLSLYFYLDLYPNVSNRRWRAGEEMPAEVRSLSNQPWDPPQPPIQPNPTLLTVQNTWKLCIFMQWGFLSPPNPTPLTLWNILPCISGLSPQSIQPSPVSDIQPLTSCFLSFSWGSTWGPSQECGFLKKVGASSGWF